MFLKGKSWVSALLGQEVLSGKKFPSVKMLDRIGESILSGDHESVTYHLTGGEPLNVHFFAKYDDVIGFLGPRPDDLELNQDWPSESVSLGNYDDALDIGSHGMRFFITADDEGVALQWKIIEAAFKLSPSLYRRTDVEFLGQPFDIIREQAELAVNEAIQNIHEENKNPGQLKRIKYWFKGEPLPTEFNAVRDYGFVVTHIFVRDFLGVQMPSNRSAIFWLVNILSLIFRLKPIKRKDLFGAANDFFLWIGGMFGNLFLNPGGRSALFTNLSKYIAKIYRKTIDDSYKAPAKGSLLERLKTVEKTARNWPEYKDCTDEEFEKLYKTKVTDILMEVAGSFQYLTGSGFANMLPAMEKWYADHGSFPTSDIEVNDCLSPEEGNMVEGFVSALNKDFENHNNSTPTFIDEALRFDTPTKLIFRKAAKDFVYKDTPISEGDLICLLTGKTMKDESLFGDKTDQFLTSEDIKTHDGHYFTFGSPDVLTEDVTRQRPVSGHHPCFGQHWARTMLRTMFNGLTQFKNIRVPELGQYTLFGPIPDDYTMAYDPPVENSSFVTIMSEFDGSKIDGETAEEFITKNPKEWLEYLKRKNPELGQDLQDSLDKYDPSKCPPSDRNNGSRFYAGLESCEYLHFMSAHIVRGDSDVESEPDYLVLEMSVDGDLENIIEDLANNFGYELLGLYTALGILKKASTRKLKSKLFDHAVNLQQSIWPTLLTNKSANGLPFCGSGELSVARIKSEANISNWLDESLRELEVSSIYETHQAKLHALREELYSTERLKDDRWVLGGSIAPEFAETANDEWNQRPTGANLGMGEVINLGIKLFPRILLLPALILFLICAALMDNIMGGNTLVVEDYTHFPIQVLPAEGVKPDWWISARNVLSYVFISVMLAGLVGMIFRKMKMASKGRMGDLCFASMIFCLIVYWPTIYNKLLTIDVFSNWISGIPYETDFLSLGPSKHIWIAVAISAILTFLVALRDLTAKIPRYQKSKAKFFAFFSMCMLVGALLHIHINLFLTDHEIVNRYLNASVFDMVFYPFGWAAIVTMTIHAYRHSYTRYKYGIFTKLNMVVFSVTAIFVFVCAFFPSPMECKTPLCEPVNLWKTLRDALIYLIAIPMVVAAIILKTLRILEPNINAPALSGGLLSSPLAGWTLLISLVFNFLSFPRNWVTKQQEGLSWPALARDSNALQIEPYRDVFSDTFLVFAIAIPFALIAIGLFGSALYNQLRSSEMANTPHDSSTPPDHIEAIMTNENSDIMSQDQIQNHMVSVQRLVPQWFRMRILLPLSFQLIRRMLTTGIIRPGFLGNVGTVHYARWVHLPKTRNYVFFSNYDGSWESYLEDFITKVSTGVNAAWSHCIGFPRTKNLMFKGVEDGDRFKRWARGSMRATPFWYSAYPDLSVEMIRRNALIRDGIVRARTTSDAEAWIDLFGSVTRPEHALQTDQIQNLVFGGAGHLNVGGTIIISRPKSEGTEAAIDFCALLDRAIPHLNFGQAKPENKATYIALAPEGLQILDNQNILDGSPLWQGNRTPTSELEADGFAPAFTLGMQHPTRKALLGDPEVMDWGNDDGNDEVLASLFLYSYDEDSYIALRKEILGNSGCQIKEIRFKHETEQEGPRREPFGFVDGVSNPILKGSKRAVSFPGSIHLINPGEIVLGYKDNRGYYPPSPQVFAKNDPHRILPALANLQPSKYPTFGTPDAKDIRDLGRNGSYLVIRQLEQNVSAFKSVTLDMAKSLIHSHANTGSSVDKMINAKKVQKIIQAKMIGRWQDGTSLVTRPISLTDIASGNSELPEPGDTPISALNAKHDNEYLFGRDDPQGHACPFGSHVRRSFPRESLSPNDPKDLDVANRHRILRRGRAYKDEAGNEGTLFICLNADLDRQFEFIQQTWVMGSNFHGLKNEYDPIASSAPKGFTIQAPGKDKYFGCVDDNDKIDGEKCPVDHTKASEYNKLQQFVTLKGGGYFFLPSKDALSFLMSLPRG